jgi:hypothetical protein
MRLFIALGFVAISISAMGAADKTPVVFTQLAKKTEIFDQLTFPAKIDSAIQAKLIADSDGVVTKIIAPLGARIPRMGTVMQLQNMEPGYSFAPMKVASPVRGVVSQIKVSVGTHCTRGQELATVIDPTANKVTIEIAAGDVNAIKTGMKGELLVSGVEKPFTVIATGVSPFVDPATGTSTVELKVLEKNALLTPGTIGQARFKANSRMGYVLPDSAVVYRGDAANVRLVVDGKSKINPITVGKKRNGNYEVLSGLKDNDELIARASMFVADGETVKVETKKEEKAIK